MPDRYNKTLEYNRGEKSLKVPFTTYGDLECLIPKMSTCENNPEESYTQRVAKHEPSGWAMTGKFSFDATKNKNYYCRESDCIKRLCKTLKDLAMEIIHYEEKQMIPLTDKKKVLWKAKCKPHMQKRVLLWWKWEKCIWAIPQDQGSLPLHWNI